ncbi:hypothetical protein OGAPHI_000297 [Ogataea philodendri]|uniref:Uncharacterized protein n=1 Tax=Ogataea philodendri TaxID=1378263 RepID=A0A9P8PHZ5_9ASCO|nr:uncharacterized protein OGAPHI_000297 [Ogataea philodendri]KAH3671594.1 hypothetical protein OGAPHI_000297 [Ogataea philodendri]
MRVCLIVSETALIGESSGEASFLSNEGRVAENGDGSDLVRFGDVFGEDRDDLDPFLYLVHFDLFNCVPGVLRSDSALEVDDARVNDDSKSRFSFIRRDDDDNVRAKVTASVSSRPAIWDNEASSAVSCLIDGFLPSPCSDICGSVDHSELEPGSRDSYDNDEREEEERWSFEVISSTVA